MKYTSEMADDEWKLCRQWLVKCGVISTTSPVMTATETIEFGMLLRDGAILCKLLNVLSPGCIASRDLLQLQRMDITQRSQFSSLKAIKMFLLTAKQTFGLSDSVLFDPSDLFELRSFRKVIMMLSHLSQTRKAREKLEPFLTEDSTVSDHHYKNLEELAATQEDIYGGVDLANDDDEDEDDIYDTLCSVRQQVQDRQGSRSKRDFCVDELVETESNYVDALNMMIKDFVRPLSRILQPKDHECIFKHIKHLSEVHAGFLAELRQACSSNGANKPQISTVFLKWKKKLLVYGDFCSNLPHARDRLDELMKEDKINRAVQDCQVKANENKFKLYDLLAFPMQRVLKYHLLLKELLKNTDDGHEDKAGLENALEAVNDLSLYINEVKRDSETLAMIADIEENICELQMPQNIHLRDYGHLLIDGELKVKSNDDQRLKTRYIFLFDKVMLMCKFSKNAVYTFKDGIMLTYYKVDEVPRQPRARSDRWSSAFQLTHRNTPNTFTFTAKTQELRDRWIDCVRMALMNTSPPGASDGRHEFIMHTFPTPTHCDVCHKLLRGVFYQGYKCCNTGKSVHKECIKKASTTAPASAAGSRPRSAQSQVSQRRPSIPSNGIGAAAPAPHFVQATSAYEGIPPPGQRKFIKFDIGDKIEVLDSDDPNWCLGRLRCNEGYFPKSYVQEYRRATDTRAGSYVESEMVEHRPQGAPSAAAAPARPSVARRSSGSGTQDLEQYEWFHGPLERQEASNRLKKNHSLGDGAFLVRESQNAANRGGYAIDIKYEGEVKHIKINKSEDGGSFYLVESRKLPSIAELVEYYGANRLDEYFPELKTKLLHPCPTSRRRSPLRPAAAGDVLGYCYASYDYEATVLNQLSLVRGERIAIISKVGEQRGWWKGRNESGKEGYFPKSYAREEM